MSIDQILARIGKSSRLPKKKAKGRRRREKKMNRLEADYAAHLEGRADVVWYRFEPVKLRLADNTYYEPDFFVMLSDGELQVHEVKGHWEDDARVKIKVAAQAFPFAFVAITRPKGKDWVFEQI